MFGTKNTSAGKQAAISAHPLFPAVVALWFAALLGLGSLVLPVALFEKAVTATGLSSLISAAAPPLGTTARIAIAIFAGIAGAGAGLFIARKVAAAQAPKKPKRAVFGSSDNDAEEHAVKPISAHEELGIEGLDEPIVDAPEAPTVLTGEKTYTGKRRSLAVTDDSGPSDYLEEAPLPGGDALIDLPADTDEAAAEDEAVEPLELAELANSEDAIDAEEPREIAEVSAFKESVAEFVTDTPEPDEIADTQNTEYLQTNHDSVAELHQELDSMTEQSSPNVPTAYNPLGHSAEPVEAEPKPFTATGQLLSDTVGEFAQPVSVAPAPSSVRMQDVPAPKATEATAPVEPHLVGEKALGDLGMVELVERFAVALNAKKEADAAAAEAASTPLVFQRSASPAAPFEPSAAEDASAGVANFFAAEETPPVAPAMPETAPEPLAEPKEYIAATATPAPSVPASMQPLAFADEGDEDSEDVIPSLSLSMRAPNAEAEIPTDEAANEDAGSSSEYSSLLAMKSPFASGQEFVRIEDDDDDEVGILEPTVVFPGSERRATPATDGPTRDPSEDAAVESAPAPRLFDAPGQSPANGASQRPTTANAGDTERALREALEKLQRMSGAA